MRARHGATESHQPDAIECGRRSRTGDAPVTTGALIFMLLSWAFVLGLTFWSFHRLLSGKRTTDAADSATPPGARPPGTRTAA